MAFRPDILAGRAVILVNIEDTIDKQLRGIRTKLRRFSNSLGDIGGDLFRFGTVGVIGSIFPVKEFIDFQDQLLFIQTKLQATDQQMMVLERTIRDLGKSTSFTSKQVGEAAAVLAQAGFSLSEIQQILLPTLDLARSGAVDLFTASNLLVQALNSFQISGDRAAEVASKLVTAVRKGPLTIVDLGESFKYASGLAAELNVDINNILASLTILSRSGTRGTLAGTQINKALQALATQKDKLKDILGIGFVDEDFASLSNIFLKFGAAMQGLSRTERVSALTEIGSIRGARALAPLVRKMGEFDDVLKEVSGSFNEARMSAEKMDSLLGGSFRKSLSAFQELMLSIGSTSEGPLTKALDGLREIFNELSSLSKSNPVFVQSLLLLPPATLAAGAGMLTMAFAVNKLASAMTPLISLNSLFFGGLSAGIGAPGDFLKKLFAGGSLKKTLGFLGKTGIGSGLSGLLGKDIPFLASLNKALTTTIGLWSRLANILQGIAANRAIAPFITQGKYIAQGSLLIGQAAAQVASGYITPGTIKRGIRGTSRLGAGIKGIPLAARISKQNAAALTGPIKKVGTSLKIEVARGLIDGSAEAASMVEKLFKGRTVRGLTVLFNTLFGQRIGKQLGFKDFFGGLKAGLNLLKQGTLVKGLAYLFRPDYIRLAYRGFLGIGSALRGVFLVLNNIRRAVFSMSGFLTVLELLIIIGPRLRPVREFFGAIGQFFKDITKIGTAIGPSLGRAFDGLKKIFSGDVEEGVSLLKENILEVVEIVQIKLVNAWTTLTEKIQPTIDKIKAFGEGLLSVFDQIVESIGIIGEATIGGITSSLPEGGQNAITTNGIKSFFAGFTEFIKVFSIEALKTFETIANTLIKIYNLLVGLGQGLLGSGLAGRFLGKFLPQTIDEIDLSGVIGKLGATPMFTKMQGAIQEQPGLIDEEKAAREREAKRRQAELEREFGKGIIPPLEKAMKPIGKSVEEQFDALIRPEGAKTPLQLFNAAKQFQEVMDGVRARAMERQLIPKKKEIREFGKAFASVGGSFAQTRGQLLKLNKAQELDKERNDLLEENKEELATLNERLRFQFA